MNELMIFSNPDFGEIRTIEEDGKVLFCGSDVAKALGYKKPNDAVKAHCRYTVKRSIPHPQSPEKAIEMLFIPEGDIYRLAAKSELPGADKFESWIFDEVLPSIRKNGGYIAKQEELSPEELMAKALMVAQKTLADREARLSALEAQNEQQRQIIADFEPIKHYVDTILESLGAMATSQIAADYDMSARRLNKILHEEGIQHCVNGRLTALTVGPMLRHRPIGHRRGGSRFMKF